MPVEDMSRISIAVYALDDICPKACCLVVTYASDLIHKDGP